MIQRLKDRHGIVYYVDELSGKQVNDKKGRSKWVRENANRIALNVEKYDNLTKEEKLSFQTQKRLKFRNKFLGKTEEEIFRRQAKSVGVKIPYGKSIEQVFGTDAFSEGIGDLTKDFSESFFRQDGEVSNKVTFSLSKHLNKILKSKNKELIAIDENGEKYEGLEAAEKIREYQNSIMDNTDDDESPIINFVEDISYMDKKMISTFNFKKAHIQIYDKK